jgi:hypothetical protein
VIVTLQQLFNRTACPFRDLLAKRRDSAGRFIFRDTLDTPHGKEQIAKPDKRFRVHYRTHPVIKRIQVEAPQEYASLTNLVEHAPTFFSRTV